LTRYSSGLWLRDLYNAFMDQPALESICGMTVAFI